MKNIFMLFLFLFSHILIAAEENTVLDAMVTKLQVYETNDDTVKVWIYLNGNSRVGPNPVNSTATCELWTHDKSVHATAMTALVSGKKVSVRYRDNGEGTYWCKVVTLSIQSN